MSGTIVEEQAANNLPPRRGQVLALGIDATARPYSLTSLAFGRTDPPQESPKREHVFLTLQVAGNQDVYFYFASATASDLDDTAKVAAGSTLSFANTYAWRLPVGEERTFRLDRNVDKFLIVKCASGLTSTLLIAASSEAL